MKRILPLALVCACSYGAFAVTFPIFDPLADATASGGTSYSDGSFLKGQTSATGNTWLAVNTNQTSGLITLIPYAFSNYAVGAPWPAPAGTEAAQVQAPPTSTALQGVRMNLTDFATNGISNGTVYASMYIKCYDISSLSVNTGSGVLQGGIFHIGFSDTVGTLATSPATLGGRWYFRKATADAGQNRLFNIGVSKVNGPTGGSSNPTAYWDSRDFTIDDELFVVVGYTFNPANTNDDVVKLWVNPPAASLGQTTEPSTTVQGGTSPADGDIKSIGSFNIMPRNPTQVTGMVFDEVRLGTNWAQVTSTNNVVTQPIIQPTLTASIVNPSTVQLSWGTNSTGFTLQSTSALLSSGTSWSPVGGSATVSGTNYIQTDAISGAKFYRLTQ